jgi:ribonuclease HI
MAPEYQKGIVLYTDGGCRDGNPGNAGWGIHGYLYTTEPQKQGTGLSDQVVTSTGYVQKSIWASGDEEPINLITDSEELIKLEQRKVYPQSYIDGYGSFGMPSTNNAAELFAAISGLLHAEQYEISAVCVLTDSQYVVNGMNDYIDRMRANNWIKPDLSAPIPNAELWKDLDKVTTQLRNRGVVVMFDWIEAHVGHLGNTIADKHATAGVMMARDGKVNNEITVTAAQGYWKSDVDKHPFINARRMYFNSDPATIEPGKYYFGSSGKDDDSLGTRISEGAFAYVELKDADPVLESIRATQSKASDGADSVVMARLDYIYSPNNYGDFLKFGEYALVRKKAFALDLYGLDDQPVTRQYRPALLAYRAIEELAALDTRLQQFKDKNESLTITDITSEFYEVTKVTKKKQEVAVTKLKDKFVVGFTALELPVKYNVTGEEKEISITLTLGMDLPSRNPLKRIETLEPSIFVISWKESDSAFRFATVITAGEDIGIWCGSYSNLRLVK